MASAEAQQQDELPSARAYGASGVVTGTLEESAALAGVPPVAMVDALGGRPIDMPATPEKVWRLLNHR